MNADRRRPVALASLALFAGTLGMAGCPDPPKVPSSTCEPNPEPIALAKGKATIEGVFIGANAATLNGAMTQGVAINGVSGNASPFNGISFEGVSLQGAALVGVSLNARADGGLQVQDGADNELVAMRNGVLVGGKALVGAKLHAGLADGTKLEVTIAAFEREAKIARYRIEHDGQPLCSTVGGKGLFVAGVFDERGQHLPSRDVAGLTLTSTFSCPNGVVAKCVEWGFAPWDPGALHVTCTRMARADYCGSGISFTRDGTEIEIFDARGVPDRATPPGMRFEAGWGPNGAVCVRRPRYDAHEEGQETPVLPSCWANLPKCASFEDAKRAGVVLGNASMSATRVFCASSRSDAAPH